MQIEFPFSLERKNTKLRQSGREGREGKEKTPEFTRRTLMLRKRRIKKSMGVERKTKNTSCDKIMKKKGIFK